MKLLRNLTLLTNATIIKPSHNKNYVAVAYFNKICREDISDNIYVYYVGWYINLQECKLYRINARK